MKNNQKGFIVPTLLAIIALLVIGGGAYIYQNKKAEAPAPINNIDKYIFTPLLKLCPSEKISNQMPGETDRSAYFILNGQRRELNEFDLNFVKKNCTVEEQFVF